MACGKGVYYQGNEEGIIDLGLSLRVVQPEVYHPPGHAVNDYGDLMGWHQVNPRLKALDFVCPTNASADETEASKNSLAYVKVNMDGVIVGRKIRILDHSDYSSLAFRLEDMFGGQSESGLKLFHAGTVFCLFYKDRNEQWRTVGDVPWKEFVVSVKRLWIVHKNKIPLPSSSGFA